jgi:hypothetical protein
MPVFKKISCDEKTCNKETSNHVFQITCSDYDSILYEGKKEIKLTIHYIEAKDVISDGNISYYCSESCCLKFIAEKLRELYKENK